MSIFSSAVEKPISTMMVFLAIVVIGVYSYITLPVDQYPKIDPPYITVMTTYPGANASDIEQNITKQLEDQLNSVDDLDEMTSTSSDNLSVITLKFEWGINLDNASNDVRDAVDKTMDALPDDVDRPTIMRMSTSMMPILVYAVTADESYTGLYKILDDKVVMSLNRVDGVASAYVAGMPERVVYIDLDPNKLDAYGLSIDRIGGTILAENRDVPGGNIKVGIEEYTLRVEGEFDDSEQIGDVVLAIGDGKTVKVSDIAQVRDTLRDISLEQLVERENGAILLVTKTSDANAVQVASDSKVVIEEAMKTLPSDIHFEMITDNSDFIIKAINNLTDTLFYALLSVVIVVFVFLGRWRSTFIIAMTIPISLVVAFIYLAVTDGSLNTISLMSLSIAIGMVVDDAIVVLENITKHVDRGSRPKEAAKYGTNEVWTSVIVTTLVTIAVFFPLTLLPGMMGIFFKPLGWIICISVTTSTVTAISLTPMLCSKILRLREKDQDKGKKYSFYNWSQRMLDSLDNFYERIVKWVLKNKTVTIVSMTLLFGASLLLAKLISTEFFPQNDQSTLTVYAKMQQGQRVEETKRISMQIDSVIRANVPELRILTTSYGSEESASFASMMSTTGSNIMNMRVRVVELKDRDRSVFEIGDDIRKMLKQFPEVIEYRVQFGQNGSTGNTVDLEIFGHDFDATANFALEAAAEMKKIPGAEDVIISRGDDKTELQLYLDREKLARHGLTTAGVGSMVRTSIYGYRNSKYKEEGEEYDIIVRLKEEFRHSISEVENFIITDGYGQKVRLKELGEIREGYSPPSITRKSKQRYIKVTVTPGEDATMGDIADAMKEYVSNVKLPQGITSLYVGGTYEDQQESFQGIILLFILAMLLVYIVMAAEFESFKMPFIIILAIPFAFTGVLLSLVLAQVTMSIVSALGCLMLVGIVTKNGIVLIDYTNLMRERGYRLYDAITMACRSRLRPVLMTSLTTMLGMLPMALSLGEGAETWRPMGISVIGGMIFSTIVTLIITPAVYAATDKSGSRDKKKSEQAQYRFMDEFDAERDLPANKKNK